MPKKVKEVDIARPIVSHFRNNQFEVYQEVEISGGIVDIVAVLGNIIHIVETKTSMNWTVIEQAMHRSRYAHFTWIAVPSPKRHQAGKRALHRFLKGYKIGVLRVESFSSQQRIKHVVYETLMPKINRHADVKRLKGWLCDEQKTFCEAGASGGGHYTGFKGTCKRIREYLGSNPGSRMKDIVDNVDHHYSNDSSARSSLSQWIKLGKVEGVIWKHVTGSGVLYYSEG